MYTRVFWQIFKRQLLSKFAINIIFSLPWLKAQVGSSGLFWSFVVHLSVNPLVHLSFSDHLSFVISSSVTFHIFIFFSRTTWTISTKLGTKHPWVVGICSNEGPHPFTRGDNYKIAKLHWQNFKIFFSRTTGSILNQTLPWASLGQRVLTLNKYFKGPFNSQKEKL